MKKFISILAGLLLLVSPFQGSAQQFKKATLINYLTGTKIVVETKEEADRGFRLGYHLYDSKLLGYNVITNYQTTLSASISSSQTTIPVSTVETKDGHVLTMDDLGNFAYLSVETGSKREEIVKCTGISGSSFTGCTRGLAFYGTSTEAVVANQYAHSAGSKVVMSNVHYVYQGFVDKQSDETIAGKKTFSELATFSELPVSTTTAPTSNSQLVNKKYVDDIIIAGGVPGTETLPGLFMLADKDDIIASTATSTYSGFDYSLVLGSDNIATSTVATTTIVATKNDGKIAQNFLDLTENWDFSGENTFTATTTLSNGFVPTTTPTAAGQILGLDENAKLPAVDGSNLTGILAKNLILSASDDLKVSSDVETVAASEGTYTKYKEIQLKLTKGVVRVSFDLKQSSAPQTVYGRIYINGVAAGTERSVTGTTDYVTFSEDLTVAKDDKIQLYMKDNGGTVTYQARNFRIYYDIELDTDFEVLMQDFAY